MNLYINAKMKNIFSCESNKNLILQVILKLFIFALMNKQTIIESIKAEKPYFGVEEIALFGSYARGEEKADSDVDILVRINKPSYNLLMGLYAYLEKKLNTKIDITRKGPHISERFLTQINKDLIYV
jgi:predicted nucleotidyltransferase